MDVVQEFQYKIIFCSIFSLEFIIRSGRVRKQAWDFIGNLLMILFLHPLTQILYRVLAGQVNGRNMCIIHIFCGVFFSSSSNLKYIVYSSCFYSEKFEQLQNKKEHKFILLPYNYSWCILEDISLDCWYISELLQRCLLKKYVLNLGKFC